MNRKKLQNSINTLRGNKYFKDDTEVFVWTQKESHEKSPMHAHEFLEIAYVIKGNGTHQVGNNQYEVISGDIFVINNYQPHRYVRSDNLEIQYIIIGTKMMKKVLKQIGNIPGFYEFFYVEPIFREETKFSHHLHMEHDIAHEIEKILEKINNELNVKEYGYKTMIDSLITEFFVDVSRLYHGFCQEHINTDEMDSKKKVVSEVISFIEHHYEQNITLSDLARCGCLQSEYLCRVFKKMTGMSMFTYLTHLRIKKASELLTHTSDSITSICFKVGFHDLSHFIRTFGKLTGMSPSAFRKKSKQLK